MSVLQCQDCKVYNDLCPVWDYEKADFRGVASGGEENLARQSKGQGFVDANDSKGFEVWQVYDVYHIFGHVWWALFLSGAANSGVVNAWLDFIAYFIQYHFYAWK